MKLTLRSRALAFTSLLAGLGLAGCGGSLNFPDAVSSQQVQGPAIRGSVYGGHAPIVGSHVYVLQPGTSGYGSPATSLLGAGGQTSASGYAITADVNDPNVPVGAKYVTTDSNGAFNLTGGYSCTAGQPVYLYSYGGTSTGITTGTVTASMTTAINQIVVSGTQVDVQNGTATYVLTLPGVETLTVGETITLANLTGNLSIINGSQTVTATSTNATAVTTSVTFTATDVYGTFLYSNGNSGKDQNTYYETVGTGTYTATSGPAGVDTVTQGGNTYTGTAGTGAYGSAATATFVATTTVQALNPIVQLATLGICPSSGNFSTAGNGALSYVYMNEVSTVATAYTFQPFTLASNNSAWDIGTSGTTQALLGINNAALTAAQLYSIQGNALISGTNDGEGHIANYQTQLGGSPNNGNGVIPQATIDTLANILAACIDSTPATTGALSTQCTSLFNTATDNGQTVSSGDTPAIDTATAMINIARYPGGNHSGSTSTINTNYVSTLYGIPSGTVPYAPNLTSQPQDDWTIAINYPQTAVTGYPGATNNLVGEAEGIAIDGNGAVWFTARANQDLVRWSPLGIQQAAQFPGYTLGYNVSVDPSNNAWTGAASGPAGIFEASSNGVNYQTYGSGYTAAHSVITDRSGDAFFFAATSSNTNSEMFEFPAGSGTSTAPGSFTISPGAIPAGSTVDHAAVDNTGDLWITSEASDQIAKVTSTGATVFTTTVSAQPETPAIDAAGNAWIAGQGSSSSPYTSYIYVVSPTGAVNALASSDTAAALSATFGSAVDGNGNVWFDSRCGYNGTCSTALGVSTLFVINGKTLTAISPPNNYIPEAQYGANASNKTLTPILHDAVNMAIDPSGNIWITNFEGNSVVEVVGAAAPVVTPLSVAAGKGLLGTKP